jgi:hypothetical protein
MMTDFALPKPFSGCDGSRTVFARAFSASTCGMLNPSIAAPPTRMNSRRVTPSHSRPLLPVRDNMGELSLPHVSSF